MEDRELWALACGKAWPALIGELGKVDVGGGQKKLLFEDGCGGCCGGSVFIMAACKNAPAPVWKALIEAALRVGLDLQRILTRGSNDKRTVLHHATYNSGGASGDEVVGCLSFLCPSALDMKDVNKRTPLDIAKARNRPSSVMIAALTQVS